MRSEKFLLINQEFEEGTFLLSENFDERASMFITTDGFFINGEVTEFGDRAADHHELMRECDCSELVIIDPERQTLIIQDETLLTEEQGEAIQQVPEYFEVMFE